MLLVALVIDLQLTSVSVEYSLAWARVSFSFLGYGRRELAADAAATVGAGSRQG